MFAEQGDYPQAIADYTRFIDKKPQDPIGYVYRGLAYQVQKKESFALENYDYALYLGYEDPQIYYDRGQIYQSLKDYDRAFQSYTKSIRLDRSFIAGYLARAELSTRIGEPDQALRDYDKLLDLDPKNANAYFLGRIFGPIRETMSKPWRIIVHSLRLDSEYAWGYFLRGNIYLQQGRHTQAIQDYTKALALCPEWPAVEKNLRLAQQRQGVD